MKNLQELIKGGIGIGKALTGIDRSPDIVKNNRINTCMNCDSCIIKNDNMKCKECGCNIKLKSSVLGEKCPRGFWKT